MDPRLLELLVCPLCKGALEWQRESAELVCPADRLAYPVRDGIPIMLTDQARSLDGGVPADAPAAPADEQAPTP